MTQAPPLRVTSTRAFHRSAFAPVALRTPVELCAVARLSQSGEGVSGPSAIHSTTPSPLHKHHHTSSFSKTAFYYTLSCFRRGDAMRRPVHDGLGRRMAWPLQTSFMG